MFLSNPSGPRRTFHSGDGLIMNETRDMIKVMHSSHKSWINNGWRWYISYGSLDITNVFPLIYSWTFKILSTHYDPSAIMQAICIDSSKRKYVYPVSHSTFFANPDRTNYYALSSNGTQLNKDSECDCNRSNWLYTYSAGDIITMEFDVKNKKLIYIIDNDDDIGCWKCIIKDIGLNRDTIYNMFVALPNKYDAIQLIKFDKRYCN